MQHAKKLLFFPLIVLLIISCSPKEIPPPAKPARIALVLGAGASKGFAHIGVIKVLEANKIPIHMIVGTSAGSFVGSLYAYGYTSYQLQKIAFSLEKGDIVDLTFPDNGFIKGERLEGYINKALQYTPLEGLRIPFYAVATDLQKGEEFVFGTGNSGMAVRASCAIPGIFKPVKISNRTYVDGGVVSPVAVDAARKYGADMVIAVDISSGVEDSPPQSTMETILQSVDVMYAKIAMLQIQKADVVIRPKVNLIGSADFAKRHEAILEGEKAATDSLPQINEFISKFRHDRRL